MASVHPNLSRTDWHRAQQLPFQIKHKTIYIHIWIFKLCGWWDSEWGWRWICQWWLTLELTLSDTAEDCTRFAKMHTCYREFTLLCWSNLLFFSLCITSFQIFAQIKDKQIGHIYPSDYCIGITLPTAYWRTGYATAKKSNIAKEPSIGRSYSWVYCRCWTLVPAKVPWVSDTRT